MATTGRDYYEILGVGRSATEAEIKRAFRRLARELHPDVSEEPDAEERFREAVAAYEVLSKTETRSLYDRFGHAGLQSGGFRPTAFDFGSLADIFSAFFGEDAFGVATRPRRGRGADVAAEVVIDLEEAASGIKREVPIQVARACDECAGERRRARHDGGDLRRVPWLRTHRARGADESRRVRPQPALRALRRRGPHRRAPLCPLRRRRPRARRAVPRDRDPGRDP